jgi:hypothetical protein
MTAKERNKKISVGLVIAMIVVIILAIIAIFSLGVDDVRAAPEDPSPFLIFYPCHLGIMTWTQPEINVDPLDPPTGWVWLERDGVRQSDFFYLDLASCIHGYCTWYAGVQIPFPAKDWMMQGYIQAKDGSLHFAREIIPIKCGVHIPMVTYGS